jgi:pimeloyl-ACP methyl ester carboxylesterase
VQPETKYARLGGDRIAYQVLGQGPPDLVMTTGGFSQIDIIWEDPGIALFLRTLASFSRLILFDRRGTGASDPLPPDPLPRGSPMPRSWSWSWTRSAPSGPRC